MGLFGKKEVCCICNSNEGSTKTADGTICKTCYNSSIGYLPGAGFNYKNIKTERVIKALQIKQEFVQLNGQFSTTKKVDKCFEVDENNKLWRIIIGKNELHHVYHYSDIIDFELLEDGETIIKGGLGSAVVGGALFGGVGAIVGGVTGAKKTSKSIKSMRIKIVLSNEMFHEEYISLIMMETNSSSIIYKNAFDSAQHILSLLTIMQNESKAPNDNPQQVSTADELLKFG